MKRSLLFLLTLFLFLAACGGTASQTAGPTVDVSGIPVGSFKGTVTGAVSGDISGTGSYFKQEEGGLLISLVAAQGLEGANVTIILPVGTSGGVYTPKSYADAYDTDANKITDVGASFSSLASTSGVDVYSIVSEGTLTLQSTDPMTGTIHFKAKLESGAEVEVTATFYQLISV